MSTQPRHDDTGAAVLSVLMVLAVLGALTLTMAAITITNLGSARLAQQSGAALSAADAGVAQGVTYLRENGVRDINRCSPTCAANPWGNQANPAKVTLPGKLGQTYKVWIEPLVKMTAKTPGYYRIHAVGEAGGPASRAVDVDVEIAPLRIPLGVVAESVTGGGTADVHRQSIFSTGCVYKRSKIEFEGIDLVHQIPAAVHSSQIISDDQGSGKYCPRMRKPIHPTTGTTPARWCDPAYPYDQDANGGPLAGTSCHRLHNGTYPETSRIIDDADLYAKYNVSTEAFTRAQLDQLRTTAQSQGNFYTSVASWAVPTRPNSVLYFDLTRTNPGGLVDLNRLSPTWSRTPGLAETDSACASRSLLIIIEGGNARLNSNSTVMASTFLISKDPYGNITKANGTSNYIGTLYGNNLDLTGTADIHMDACFLANTSPALNTVRTFNYRELDR